MIMTITIQEIQQKKLELTNEIFNLVETFERDTGCDVVDVHVNRVDKTVVNFDGVHNQSRLYSVDLTVRL